MAQGNRRFGAYLRALRESRHWSLDHVEALTDHEGEPITRSLLSRLERGEAGVSAARLLTLARLYNLPSSELAERLDTDEELARIDFEAAAGLDAAELLRRGEEAIKTGDVKRALLLYEEAETHALRDGADGLTARVRARLGVARALGAVGRCRSARGLALELLGGPLQPQERAWALFLFAKYSLELGHVPAMRFALLALKEVPTPWPPEVAAAAPWLDGEYLLFENRLKEAMEAFLAAVDAARAAFEPSSEALALVRLATVSRLRNHPGEAFNWIVRAKSLASRHALPRSAVKAEIEEGRIHIVRRRADLARQAWVRGRQIARHLGLNADLFEIFAELWRLARTEGAENDAKSALQNLRRLAPLFETLPRGSDDLAPLLFNEPPSRLARRTAGPAEDEGKPERRPAAPSPGHSARRRSNVNE